MVKLAAASPNWAALLPRWSALTGATITVDHQIGDVWVLKLAAAVPDTELAAMAAQLETDAVVQYADPVRRVFALRSSRRTSQEQEREIDSYLLHDAYFTALHGTAIARSGPERRSAGGQWPPNRLMVKPAEE